MKPRDEILDRIVPPAADALIVVPPFTSVTLPPLGPHLLQAIGRREGFDVRVVYGNLFYAHSLGLDAYQQLTEAASRSLSGERVFAAAAYGGPPLGRHADRLRQTWDARLRTGGSAPSWELYLRAEALAKVWADSMAGVIAAREFVVVGCTSMFEQTSASLALLNRIKLARPKTVCILGGANCEGEMADGLLSLDCSTDYIFSGEADETFPRFLHQVHAGSPPDHRILRGGSPVDLENSPTPDFTDYFEQLQAFFPFEDYSELWDRVQIPYESSRGCWWGQKHHCTFCGLNGLAMRFREKSADRVLEQLSVLRDAHPLPAMRVAMTDNIMPRSYFQSMLPRLATSVPRAELFYEQKANLSLSDVTTLWDAGIVAIQPGIESLSTSYLKRMDKGVTAAQNIRLLRYAKSKGLKLYWSILTDFPGDEREELEEMLSLIPLLTHLQPPGGVSPLSIDRFAPYFEGPARYGLEHLRPIAAYEEVFPPGADVSRLAYFFTADYESASRRFPDSIARLKDAVAAWRAAWHEPTSSPPVLTVMRGRTGSEFALVDTRQRSRTRPLQGLSRDQAASALVSRRFSSSALDQWAIAAGVAVHLDGLCVPLATADVDMLQEFESEARKSDLLVPATSTAIPVLDSTSVPSTPWKR